ALAVSSKTDRQGLPFFLVMSAVYFVSPACIQGRRRAVQERCYAAAMGLLAKAASGTRLTPEEAVALHELPLFDLAAAAHEVRLARTDPETVSYLIDRNVNYSNVCNVGCSFCGFYRTRRQADAYVLTYEQVSEKLAELETIGGTRVLMQGGVNPYLPFEWYTGLLSFLKERHPGIRLEVFSPEEI